MKKKGIKGSFVFYRSFYEAINKLKNKELKADIYEAICELSLNNNDIKLNNDVGLIIMDLIKPQIEANNKKYENGVKYGYLGGRPKEYDKNEIIELINQGLKNDEIKEKIGCSLTLIKSVRKELKDKKSKTVKNTNVNVNENENVNVCMDNVHTQNTHTFDMFLSFLSKNYSEYNQNDLKKSCKKFFNYYEEKNWEGIKKPESRLKLWIDDDIKNGKIKETKRKRYL